MASSSGIYCWKHIESGKRYIGQSIDIFRRMAEHRKLLRGNRHGNGYFQKAWLKYGEDGFEFSVIEFCPQEVLSWKEEEWISKHQTTKKEFGYNGTAGGEAPKLTEEIKNKISKSHTGKKHSEGTRQKMRNAWEHRPPISFETRKKMADSIRGEKHYLWGKKIPIETRKKLSESHKAFHQSKRIALEALEVV